MKINKSPPPAAPRVGRAIPACSRVIGVGVGPSGVGVEVTPGGRVGVGVGLLVKVGVGVGELVGAGVLLGWGQTQSLS